MNFKPFFVAINGSIVELNLKNAEHRTFAQECVQLIVNKFAAHLALTHEELTTITMNVSVRVVACPTPCTSTQYTEWQNTMTPVVQQLQLRVKPECFYVVRNGAAVELNLANPTDYKVANEHVRMIVRKFTTQEMLTADDMTTITLNVPTRMCNVYQDYLAWRGEMAGVVQRLDLRLVRKPTEYFT